MNLLSELKELNSWIAYFNQQKGKITPRLHRFGVKNETRRRHGNTVRVQHHLMNQWEFVPVQDRLLLNDTWKVRLGLSVVRHFKGEIERFGILG